MNRKHVLIDGDMPTPESIETRQTSARGPPEMSDHIHITSIILYCCNCSILLVAIVANHRLCLTYKLNSIICMQV